MKINDWNRRKQIIREGYFENCDYLPAKLTEFPYYDCYLWEKDDVDEYSTPKTFHGNGVKVFYREQCDIGGVSVFPTYSGGCDLWHCYPIPIKKIDAKNMALFARKYGVKSYMRKYKSNKAIKYKCLIKGPRYRHRIWDKK